MTNGPDNRLGLLLKQLRLKRNRSQEEVARASDIAHNYYGEIERNRRDPGRETLLSIAQRGLGLNLNETNLVLLAGGYAPLPQVLTSVEMARLFKLVEAYLQKMLPYPALVVGQMGHILKWNSAFPLVFGVALEKIPSRKRNLLRLTFDPDYAWRDCFVGWEAFARYQVALFQRTTLGLPPDDDQRQLLEDLHRLPGFEKLWQETTPELVDTFLAQEWPLRLPLPFENRLLHCRTMLTYFDQYARLFALSFFPADPASEELFKQLERVAVYPN